MIIPVRFPESNSSAASSLPPVLTKLGSNEIVLIELQGFLDAEGDTQGGPVGTLNCANPVLVLTCRVGASI